MKSHLPKWLRSVVGRLATATALNDKYTVTVTPFSLSDAAVRARADALIAKMTPEEKAGQLTQYFDVFPDPEEKKRVADEVAAGRAGSILDQHDPVELNRLQYIAVEKTRLKIPLCSATT